MSEISEPTRPTSVATTPVDPAVVKPYWLYRLAAWVAIVAGIVFTVAVIFFSGAFVAHQRHHGHHGHWKPHAMVHPHRGPGHGPGGALPGGSGGGPGAGLPGPGQLPQSLAPSTAPARP